jgi:hypothetical protein
VRESESLRERNMMSTISLSFRVAVCEKFVRIFLFTAIFVTSVCDVLFTDATRTLEPLEFRALQERIIPHCHKKNVIPKKKAPSPSSARAASTIPYQMKHCIHFCYVLHYNSSNELLSIVPNYSSPVTAFLRLFRPKFI